MILILCNDAIMTPAEIAGICGKQKWVPVMAYRPKGDADHPPILIAFEHQELAYRFAKRNVSSKDRKKGWLRGAVQVGDATVAWIKAKGWQIDMKTWPDLMVDNPKWDISVEVVDVQEELEVNVIRG